MADTFENESSMTFDLEIPQNDPEAADAEGYLQTPLFAHERLGAYELPDTPEQDVKRTSKNHTLGHDIDVHDPTLEQFPSDRSSIMDALRKIQTSKDENHGHLEEFRSSLRAGSREASMESTDEAAMSPGSLSPVSTRRRDSRPSHSSFGRSRSAVSLGSIVEEDQKASSAEEQSFKTKEGTDTFLNGEDELGTKATSKVNPEPTTDTVSLSQNDQSNDTVVRHHPQATPHAEADLTRTSTRTTNPSQKSNTSISKSGSRGTRRGSMLLRLCQSLARVFCGTKRAT